MKDMLEKILETEIFTYRLTDGSYIVAEELESDNNVTYVALPAQIVYTDDYHLTNWNITSAYDLTELNCSNIVSRADAPFELKAHYMKYLMICRSNQDEVDERMKSLFDMDDDIFGELDEQIPIEHSNRFNWKPENN